MFEFFLSGLILGFGFGFASGCLLGEVLEKETKQNRESRFIENLLSAGWIIKHDGRPAPYMFTLVNPKNEEKTNEN